MKHLFGAFILSALLVFQSCDDDTVFIPNQEELITTLIYTLSPSGGGEDVVFKFEDLDGDGGNNPVITTDTLGIDTTYSGVLRLLNESTNPIDEITTEVEAEADEHQFFFNYSGSSLTIEYDDADGDGKPLGLDTEINTTTAETGTLTIILRHQPDKSAAGVMDGDVTNAGGETDIEVSFPVVIE